MAFFKSNRLTYRAIEETDEDKAYMHLIRLDASSQANSNPRVLRPARKVDSDSYTKYLANEALLGVMMCIPNTNLEEGSKPGLSATTPIGYISLRAATPTMEHNRNSSITIEIEKEYQGKGYGSETILWVLEWAFMHAGLHRVHIGCFSYNTGAFKLYKKLGFEVEGRQREVAWHNGQWHDAMDLGMLEGEWRAKYGAKHVEE
jgi:RimJ/RimL family protein N-acetyltransferase